MKNIIFKNAEESALTDGFDQVIAKDKNGKLFFTRLMGDIKCSCITEKDKIIGIAVKPGINKANFIRI